MIVVVEDYCVGEYVVVEYVVGYLCECCWFDVLIIGGIVCIVVYDDC